MITIESKRAKQIRMVKKDIVRKKENKYNIYIYIYMKYIMEVDLMSITTNTTITYVIFVLE